VESVGKAGGLALFCKVKVESEVIFSNTNAIMALVFSDSPDTPWLLLVVYGLPYLGKK
jgi:hypothetical protein